MHQISRQIHAFIAVKMSLKAKNVNLIAVLKDKLSASTQQIRMKAQQDFSANT